MPRYIDADLLVEELQKWKADPPLIPLQDHINSTLNEAIALIQQQAAAPSGMGDNAKTVFCFNFVPSPALSNLGEAVFLDAQGVELGRITDINLPAPKQQNDVTDTNVGEMPEVADKLGFTTGEQPAKDDGAVDEEELLHIGVKAFSDRQPTEWMFAEDAVQAVIDAVRRYLSTPQQPAPLDLPPMTEEERRELVDGMYDAYKDDCHFPTSTTGMETALALIESRYTLVPKGLERKGKWMGVSVFHTTKDHIASLGSMSFAFPSRKKKP